LVQVSGRLHIDDDDTALRRVVILFALLILRLGTPAFIAQGDFQARPLVAAPLLLLATTDLFDDPRFEHGTENL
jgi:hypothetical protein